jgi:hypothetical protein
MTPRRPTATPTRQISQNWVTAARTRLTERKLLRSGDQFIGQILSQTPEDPDGTWPGLLCARMLYRIAESWDQLARQEDQLAAVREDFWT